MRCRHRDTVGRQSLARAWSLHGVACCVSESGRMAQRYRDLLELWTGIAASSH
jgi:hypothetical protein